MSTTVRAVERYLETDLIVSEALHRGVLNVRRAARWLIETQGWDATEEAVVSALRRYTPHSRVDLENVLHLLNETRVTARTGLSIVAVPRTREFMSELHRLSDMLRPEATLGIVPEDGRVNILIDSANRDRVLALFSNDPRCEVKTGVAEIQFEFPEMGATASTAVAVTLNVLGHRGIDVVAVFSNLPVCSILMAQRDFGQAFEVVEKFTDGE